MRHMVRSKFGFGFILAAAIATAAVYAVDRHGNRSPSLKVVDPLYDPDAGSIVEGYVPLFDTAGVATCESVGGTNVQLMPRLSAYRGNVFKITSETIVESFSMALTITQPNNLQFTIHERLVDDTFRFIDSISQFNVSGSGMFSSGPFFPAVTLSAGTQYALGVAWGGSDVVYFRNSIQNPVEFITGNVLGRIGTGSVTLPIEDLLALQIGTIGAYGMEVCIKPAPGACCMNGGCVDEVSAAVCAGPGIFYHGDRTICSEINCVFGRCCTSCGECFDNYSQEACELSGGSFLSEAVCPTDPDSVLNDCPPVTGACCETNQPCTEVCSSQCNGVYHGDGTTCDPDMCIGACCVANGCADLSPTECEQFGITYQGDGTTCATLSPELMCTGACCSGFDGLNACDDTLTRATCHSNILDTFYRGDGTDCPNDISNCIPVDETTGSCCLSEGICINTTETFCKRSWVLGTFTDVLVGGKCDENTCVNALGSCCIDGTCSITTSESCQGIWALSGVCDPYPCTPQTGSCCSFDEFCSSSTEADCNANNGLYQGDDSICDGSCVSFGSCCRSDGTCFDQVSQTNCADLTGVVLTDEWNNGGDCATAVCPSNLGACCTIHGTCLEMFASECFDRGGDFRGEDTDCTIGCTSGACCLSGGGCENRTFEACNGIYTGDGVLCDSGLCTLGACCRSDGICEDSQIARNCSTVDDDFNSEMSCSQLDPLCSAIEACCFSNQTCQMLREPDCVNAGGNFLGGGLSIVTCDEMTCTFGACCRSNGLCDNFIVLEECMGENEQFNSGSFCSELVPLCSAVGACCQLDGSCTEQREQDCSNANGLFQGTDTTCADAGVCSIGACCVGTTCSPTTELNCINLGGIYNGDGVPCSVDTCTLGSCCNYDGIQCIDDVISSQCTGPTEEHFDDRICGECLAQGSCCKKDGTCSIQPKPFCTDSGGVYGGDTTPCQPDSCTVGACCMPNGACNNTFTLMQCLLSDGIYQGPGEDCAPLVVAGACSRGACCDLDGTCFDNTVISACDASSTFISGDTCNDVTCEARAACCRLGNPVCEILTRFDCFGLAGSPSENGVPCEEDWCVEGACCKADESCEILTRQKCESNSDTYLGPDTACKVNICSCQPVLFITDPPNCAIDPRYPREISNASAALGWNPLIIGFDCDPGDLTPANFAISGVNQPFVVAVEPSGEPFTFLVTLSHPIAAGVWTEIKHVPGGSFMNLGSLPGDTNNNKIADQEDITFLIEYFNGNIAPVALWQCDIDHSSVCTPADILALINLLNGAGMFDIWMNDTLPVCPTGGP